MTHLDIWVPTKLREAAWNAAFNVYLIRATTTDGSERKWAAERADRFWPIYIPRTSYAALWLEIHSAVKEGKIA